MAEFKRITSFFCLLCIFSCLFSGCGFKKNVTDYELTVKLHFGTHNGTYTGTLKGGKPNGVGKFVCPLDINVVGSGWVYDGSWVDGHMQGPGKFSFDSGEIRDGVFDMDDMVSGKIYLTDGSIYEGETRDGIIYGKGTLTRKDGTVYEGEFKDGKFNVRVKIFYTDGSVYEGEFANNQMNGRGTLLWVSGASYTGDFVNDKYHGKGVFTWADGSKYAGDFTDDQITGEGSFYDTAGQKIYSGGVKNAAFHGKGTEFSILDGSVIRKGTYKEGNFIGE